MPICRHCGSPTVLRGESFARSAASRCQMLLKILRRGKEPGKRANVLTAAIDPWNWTRRFVLRAVSQRRSRALPRFLTDGAVTGFLVGSGGGVLLVVAFSGNPNWFVTSFWLLAGGIAGALGGSVFGAILGAASRELPDE